jgi:hypothetical protein
MDPEEVLVLVLLFEFVRSLGLSGMPLKLLCSSFVALIGLPVLEIDDLPLLSSVGLSLENMCSSFVLLIGPSVLEFDGLHDPFVASGMPLDAKVGMRVGALPAVGMLFDVLVGIR